MTKNFLSWVYRILIITIFQGTTITHPAPLNVEIVVLTKDSCVEEMSISLFSSNTIISDCGHGSQRVCMAIAVSVGDLCSGWKMWSYEVQWLSASMPGVQDSAQCEDPGTEDPVDLGAPRSNPLHFWPCFFLKARGILCSPSLQHLTFDLLTSSYSGRNHFPPPLFYCH